MKRCYKRCMDCGRQFRGSAMTMTCYNCNKPTTGYVVYAGKSDASKQWAERHEVMSSDLERTYIVSKHIDGHWACSCPQWKFHRRQCKHIDEAQWRSERTKAVSP